MRKTILTVMILGGAGLVVWQMQAASGSEEEPNYVTSLKEGNFEVRRYPQLIAAQVDLSIQEKDHENAAFKILAGYIFGKNRSKTKIAMTVPVTEKIDRREKIAMTVPVTEIVREDGFSMRFFLPSKYTMETVPEPLDDRVKLMTAAPQKFAVLRFSGSPNEKNMNRQAELLSKHIAEHSLEASGSPIRAFYNPPWTLPFLRRNEVWISLKDAD